jgi:hypothetical protein
LLLIAGLVCAAVWIIINAHNSSSCGTIGMPITSIQIDTILSVTCESLDHDIVVGDANANGHLDIDDAIYIIKYIYEMGPPPLPERYCSVRQAYIRQMTVDYVIDSINGNIADILDVHECGTVYYVPQVDSVP